MGECPLVIIRWLDSRQPCGQWRYLASLPDAHPVEVATVGWLVKHTQDVMVVCQNVGDLDNPERAQASGIMAIPTRCVLSVEKLTEEEELSVSVDPAGSTDFAGSENSATISGGRLIATGPTQRVL